ncbi:hypothetical protein SG34_027870 [Thalassomonas viridans]|uniref:Uncharacterized protein n=1 Tax=Thalassomonas viridans TaxID=137584 RepID=A0AAE9Z2Y3_9GAMM|nr:hypothetical protein [Thalassomonas viridans]WDE05074.1 hypothetical protein SG34_027870 [Thalassomonas viridans]
MNNLKMIFEGLGGSKGKEPLARKLTTNELNLITGGSGIHNGADPAAHTVAVPAADSLVMAPFNSDSNDDKGITGK